LEHERNFEVYIRKKFAYIAHATTTYSAEHSATVIDHISEKTGCPNLPFAIRLIEGNEMIISLIKYNTDIIINLMTCMISFCNVIYYTYFYLNFLFYFIKNKIK
jgi:hypothetical protein